MINYTVLLTSYPFLLTPTIWKHKKWFLPNYGHWTHSKPIITHFSYLTSYLAHKKQMAHTFNIGVIEDTHRNLNGNSYSREPVPSWKLIMKHSPPTHLRGKWALYFPKLSKNLLKATKVGVDYLTICILHHVFFHVPTSSLTLIIYYFISLTPLDNCKKVLYHLFFPLRPCPPPT